MKSEIQYLYNTKAWNLIFNKILNIYQDGIFLEISTV